MAMILAGIMQGLEIFGTTGLSASISSLSPASDILTVCIQSTVILTQTPQYNP